VAVYGSYLYAVSAGCSWGCKFFASFFRSFFWGQTPKLVTQDPKLSRGMGTARIRPQAEASSGGFAIPCPVKCFICTISPEVNEEIDLFQNAYNPSCEVRSSRHYPIRYTIHLFPSWVVTYLSCLASVFPSLRFCVHYCMDRDTVPKKNRASCVFFDGLSTTNLKMFWKQVVRMVRFTAVHAGSSEDSSIRYSLT